MSKFDYFLLRTTGTGSRPMYIHEIRGVIYVSWVTEKDRSHACMFPSNKKREWITTMESLAGRKLIPMSPDGTDA